MTNTKNKHRNRYTYQELKIVWFVRDIGQEKHLVLRSILGEYFFTVPLNWKFKKWSPACRRLAEVLVFWAFWDRADLNRFLSEDWTPWIKTPEPRKDPVGQNEPGEGAGAGAGAGEGTGAGAGAGAGANDPLLRRWDRRMNTDRAAVSFSGGLDSCAIVPLLPPGAVLAYMKRRTDKPTMMRHGQQLLAMGHLRKKYKVTTFIMESNFELVAVKSIGRIGFPSEYACTLPCVILADHSGITSICTGTIGLFLKSGKTWHDFSGTKYYQNWTSLFAKAGIDLFWPVGGVVDRGTALICKKAGIPGQSCVRNDNGSCGRCFKCFRKNTLCMEGGKNAPRNTTTGRVLIPEEAKRKLRNKPLTLIELYQKGMLTDKRLEKWKKLDLSYQKHYLAEVYDYMVPERMREHIVTKLNYFLKPMNSQQIRTVKKLNMEKAAKELEDVL